MIAPLITVGVFTTNVTDPPVVTLALLSRSINPASVRVCVPSELAKVALRWITSEPPAATSSSVALKKETVLSSFIPVNGRSKAVVPT